ncbi:DUF5722 domain-containing protein [Aeoliella sp.]|uniref:DUF5722 domain-containing protein n=1 Tax=Aeoliella sp. TaxID=2795800 RepID=UPI003CCBDEF7
MKRLPVTASVRWFLALAALAVCQFALAEPIASKYQGEFPTAKSKKGLQVEMVDDALALGVKHAAINVALSQLAIPPGTQVEGDTLNFEANGHSYAVRKRYLQSLDAQIRGLSDQGVLVYAILLVYASEHPGVNQLMMHPRFDPAAPNHMGQANIANEQSREYLTALIGFLAERWSNPDGEHGRVVGYIVGNEVNSHWYWNNVGRASFEEVADMYWQTLKLVHHAVRRQASWPRVYISLDHFWNIRYPAGDADQTFAGRRLVDDFARRGQESAEDDFDWHVAYHPYPEDLFNPRFWNDKTALPTFDTPRITFKNLEVLVDYMAQPQLQHQGQPRRIILSEQGFHSTNDPEGELLQAAAYCAAYRKVAKLNGIDAFILHRHVDHPHEGGLNLGLRTREPDGTRRPKKIYECFRVADTPQWHEAFEFALPILGREEW